MTRRLFFISTSGLPILVHNAVTQDAVTQECSSLLPGNTLPALQWFVISVIHQVFRPFAALHVNKPLLGCWNTCSAVDPGWYVCHILVEVAAAAACHMYKTTTHPTDVNISLDTHNRVVVPKLKCIFSKMLNFYPLYEQGNNLIILVLTPRKRPWYWKRSCEVGEALKIKSLKFFEIPLRILKIITFYSKCWYCSCNSTTL